MPAECFYERFGSFTNYLWYRDFFRHWKNDLGNMVSLRSINRATRDRLQAQLAIGESEMARVMGPQVINDVAFIGLDYYLRDGAAFGIIFQANNNFLLSRNFNGQRDEAAAKNPDAKLETVQIAGHDVSFLSTPDGKLRSYYAVDGDFHLITTSRRLVERFLEVGAANGAGSIGSLPEFQHTRSEMPLSRDDTVFLYLSTPFFENMASPAYRTELDRRLRSIGEMRVLEIARMAAKAEGSSARTVDELVAADLLPQGFGDRADGSRLVAEKSGYRDSVRGTPGWFVPIADMPVGQITRAEAAHYAEFMRSIDAEVGRFVPVAAAVQRRTSDDGQLDRINLDVRVAPYSQTRIVKWARMLGPEETTRVAPIAGDVASLEVERRRARPAGATVRRPARFPHAARRAAGRSQAGRCAGGLHPRLHRHLAAAAGAARPLPRPPDRPARRRRHRPARGLVQSLAAAARRFLPVLVPARRARGSRAATGDGRGRAAGADSPADRRLARQANRHRRERPRLHACPASVREREPVHELAHDPIARAARPGPRRRRATRRRPLRRSPRRQVRTSWKTASVLQHAGATCEALPTPGARRLWASTAVTPQNRFLLTEIPADYQMPLMEWFRGLTLEVARVDSADALTLHAELDMVHQDVTPPEAAGEGGLKLPSLGGLFGWGEAKEEAAKPYACSRENSPSRQSSRLNSRAMLPLNQYTSSCVPIVSNAIAS